MVSPVRVPTFDDVYAAAAVRERVGGVVEYPRAHAWFACAFYSLARVGFEVGEPQSHGLFPLLLLVVFCVRALRCLVCHVCAPVRVACVAVAARIPHVVW